MDLEKSYTSRFSVLEKEFQKLSFSIKSLKKDELSTLSDLCSSLPARERCELCYVLAQSISVLYCALLRCQGTDASKHAVTKENERLKSYLDKLIQADASVSKPTVSVNIPASSRMIKHHLNN